MKILELNEFNLIRSSKMSVSDFLKLLNIFNKEGIHFKWFNYNSLFLWFSFLFIL